MNTLDMCMSYIVVLVETGGWGRRQNVSGDTYIITKASKIEAPFTLFLHLEPCVYVTPGVALKLKSPQHD